MPPASSEEDTVGRDGALSRLRLCFGRGEILACSSDIA